MGVDFTGAAPRSGFDVRLARRVQTKRPEQALLVQPRRFVLVDAGREDFRFPGACRCFEAFELAENRGEGIGALHPCGWRHALPFEQEAQEVARLNGLDLGAQAFDGVAVDARQEPALAPFLFGDARGELAAHGEAFSLQGGQCRREVGGR